MRNCPPADAQGEPQVRRKHAQREPEVERVRQPARPAAQAAQQIVMQAECRPEGGGQQELPGLQQQRLLHSAQQAREQAALTLRLLIGHCVHGPVDGDLVRRRWRASAGAAAGRG